jgi:predicted amidohydrolase
MSRYVKISNLSISPYQLNTESNYPRIVEKVREHIDERIQKVLPDKPDLIVLPEVCDRPAGLPSNKVMDYYHTRGNRILDYLKETAKKHKTYIAYSAARQEKNGRWRNSTQIIDRKGKIAGIYDKNHLVVEENTVKKMQYGNSAHLIKCDFGTVACAICFDLNFDELRLKYVKAKPDIILFSSAYHGGLMQAYWAYSCRAHLVAATVTRPGTIISPVGSIIASTTNYFEYVTAAVNLDCCVAHLDYNWEKLDAMKKKYGTGVKIYDPGYLGSVLISSEMKNKSVKDMIKEFKIELLDDYFKRVLAHRHTHIRR